MERISPLGNATIAKCPRRKHWNCDALHQITRAAVAAAYGWPADISDDDAIARLFALNQERARNE